MTKVGEKKEFINYLMFGISLRVYTRIECGMGE